MYIKRTSTLCRYRSPLRKEIRLSKQKRKGIEPPGDSPSMPYIPIPFHLGIVPQHFRQCSVTFPITVVREEEEDSTSFHPPPLHIPEKRLALRESVRSAFGAAVIPAIVEA